MATSENEKVKSRRDGFMDRMKGKYPDKQFADDEEIFGQISDDYDEYDKQLAGYKEREGKFADMFSSDPRSASFLMNWKNGEDPAVALVRMFGNDIKEAIDDPDRQEEMAAANKEFVERVAKEKELEDTYQKNLAESLKTIDAVQQKNGLSDEQVDAAMTMLLTIVKDGIEGKFSAESIDLAMKALNHDGDVQNASQEAEVRGRNAKIKEQLRKPQQGDGMAQMQGRPGGGGAAKKKSIFDLAGEAM